MPVIGRPPASTQTNTGAPSGPRGPIGVPASENQQIFKAWDKLMHAIGDYTPKQLNKATFYRARLDDVVR